MSALASVALQVKLLVKKVAIEGSLDIYLPTHIKGRDKSCIPMHPR